MVNPKQKSITGMLVNNLPPGQHAFKRLRRREFEILLSMGKKMTEAMKGNIECKSELGNGTAFIVSYPPASHSTREITQSDMTALVKI
jgi:hypothetical protein